METFIQHAEWVCYEFILMHTVWVRVCVFKHVGTVASAMWTQPIAARLNKSLKVLAQR